MPCGTSVLEKFPNLAHCDSCNCYKDTLTAHTAASHIIIAFSIQSRFYTRTRIDRLYDPNSHPLNMPASQPAMPCAARFSAFTSNAAGSHQVLLQLWQGSHDTCINCWRTLTMRLGTTLPSPRKREVHADATAACTQYPTGNTIPCCILLTLHKPQRHMADLNSFEVSLSQRRHNRPPSVPVSA